MRRQENYFILMLIVTRNSYSL